MGRLLTEKNINVRAMKSKIVDIWKPAIGINIKELDSGIFLFQFYHREDLLWVMSEGPWQFKNVMLSIDLIPDTDDLFKVPLWQQNIWIHIHDLPTGLMTKSAGKQIEIFCGKFLKYDHKNNTNIWKESMITRAKLDVRKPFKRMKKITRRNGVEVVVICKYERLENFCFIYGFVTYIEQILGNFLKREVEKQTENGVLGLEHHHDG